MELKVQCDCGQKYKFDVTPVNGAMPFTVNCPACGLDGTTRANELIRQSGAVTGSNVPTGILISGLTLPASAPAPAPAPIASGAAAAPPPVPLVQARVEKPRLRISSLPAAAAPVDVGVPAAVGVEPSAVAIAPPPPPAAPAAAPAKGRRALRGGGAVAGKKTRGRPNFALGLVGAFAGALVGGGLYFLIFSYTGFRIKLLAIAVGFLAGLGARLLGKEGSTELGVITGTLAVSAIIGAQYFVAWSWWHEGGSVESKRPTYESSIAEARKVVAAVPTGSDQEIRTFLAKENAAESGEIVAPAGITDEEILQFRQSRLPDYQNLASGKTTREEFDRKLKAEQEQAKKEDADEEGTFKWFFMLLVVSKLNIISVCAAAGLAYKMSTDA